MTLISLLIVLMLEQYIKASSVLEKEYKSHTWFPRWTKWVSKKFNQSWFNDWGGLAVIIGLPILVIYLITDLNNGFLFWLFQLLLAVVILVYCLGPIDQNSHLKDYFEAVKRDDLQAAYHHIEDNLAIKTNHDKPENLPALGRLVTRLILTQSNFRYFAVLFYFILLGPAGALLYRLTGTFEFTERDEQSSVFREKLAKMRNALNWLPARLTAFLYTLAGDFTGAMKVLKQHLVSDKDGEDLIEESGLGALGISSDMDEQTSIEQILAENNNALDLVRRSAVVLLVITAVLTVFGWLS